MQARHAAYNGMQRSMSEFSAKVLGRPLRPYQVTWADRVVAVASARRPETIVVEMPRQSGKNETSAQVEVALLARHARRGGDIVKTAPTWKPQIVNSKLRFDARAQDAARRLYWLQFKPAQGYIYQCGAAAIQFLSADPNSSVVGATASLMMEIDEAQDVDKAKYNKDFAPMRASTAAPIVAYGTSWTDDTLLEELKNSVLSGRSPGQVYRVSPDQVADASPAYGAFVDGEVARLGRDHPLIKTQYFLEPLAQAGRMLGPQQLEGMIGRHQRQRQRGNQPQIVAGLDFAGADELAGDLVSLTTGSQRDSVALTLGAVEWITIAEGLIVPYCRILDRYEWVNVNPVTVHSALYDILATQWQVDSVCCDATGIGGASTAFLAAAINRGPGFEPVRAITFDGAWTAHTRLTFQYLAMVNGRRLVDYAAPFDPTAQAKLETQPEDITARAWWQRGHAKLTGKTGQKLKAAVPEAEGHDDLFYSELLMVDAAYNLGQPAFVTSDRIDFYGGGGNANSF